MTSGESTAANSSLCSAVPSFAPTLACQLAGGHDGAHRHADDQGVWTWEPRTDKLVVDVDDAGNDIKLRFSERNMLRYARERYHRGADIEKALANDLVTVLERLGRMRAGLSEGL